MAQEQQNRRENFSKYEIARILGARALQIAMNAPLLVKISQDDLEKVNYDALKIAEIEFDSGILPISIHRPFPIAKEEGELKADKTEKMSQEKKEALEAKEEEEITKSSEFMEIANPEDEEGEEETA